MGRREWLSEQAPTVGDGGHHAAARSATYAGGKLPILSHGSVSARLVEAARAAVASSGLQVAVAAAEPAQLALRFEDASGAAFDIVIEPAREQGRYYRKVGALGMWHARETWPHDAVPDWPASLLKDYARLLSLAQFDVLSEELASRDRDRSEPDPQRPYARQRVLGAADVERFFHVDYEYEEGADVDQPPTSRIGIIYQCNQPCTFCQLAEMNTHIPPRRILAALDASRARGARRVILTGGEPTMCASLVDYINYAREHGFTTIEMQTNATLLDRPERALQLQQAGLTDAQVSLHGPDSDISDRLTAAPGTHQRTLAGIGNLLEAGVRVLLNHLIFRDNCHLLLQFVEMVETRWGHHRDRLIIQFHSPLNEFARNENAQKHIARYSDYAPLLAQAIDRARQLRYMVKDLQDPTGIPALCVLDAQSSYLGALLSQRTKPRFHRWESEWLTRVEACKSCDLADACMGIPRAYVQLHGDSEFHAIRLSANQHSMIAADN